MKRETVGLLGLLVFVSLMVWGCGQGQQATNYGGLEITPETANLTVGATQQFVVSGVVKSFSTGTSSVTWAVIGGIGTIDATGLFTPTAEGTGTVEASMDSVVGRATVMISSGGALLAGKTVSGIVKNSYITGDNISSAVVTAGGKATMSGSDGTYLLSGVSLTADAISAAVPSYIATTVQLTGETINIPMGYPVQSNYYSPPYETTTVKGRLVDGSGNPIGGSWDNVQRRILFEEASGSPWVSSDGTFSAGIAVPKSKSSISGYITVVYKESEGVYKSAIKEITLVRGVTLEVGDIVVSEPAAKVMGTITIPSGHKLINIEGGIAFSSSKMSIYNSYSGSSASTYNYTFYLPPTPIGKKYYILAYGQKGDDWPYAHYTAKCLLDLNLSSGGTYTYDFTLPAEINCTYPSSGQTGVSATPRFEWISLGTDYVYLVLVGNGYGTKWWGFTAGTSLEYPSFPIGSGGEVSNLQNGQEYYLTISGYKIQGLNLADIKMADFYAYSEYSQMSSIPFTVGSASASGVRAMGVKDKEGFDKQIKQFLERNGIKLPEPNKI